MRLYMIGLLIVCCSYAAFSQANDIYVRMNGKVLSERDSSAVSASIRYEKLPYYDDMGVAKSSSDGNYEFYLLNGQTYTFKLKADGFLETKLDVKISDTNGDASMTQTFYITPEYEPDLMRLEHLIFARGSEQISESSFHELDDLVEYLDARPSIVIQLEGHTDFAGNADANMRLSEARVEAVKDYLLKKGVKKTRVLTKAFGGTQPLFTERTDEAKTQNRRVEVRVIKR